MIKTPKYFIWNENWMLEREFKVQILLDYKKRVKKRTNFQNFCEKTIENSEKSKKSRKIRIQF